MDERWLWADLTRCCAPDNDRYFSETDGWSRREAAIYLPAVRRGRGPVTLTFSSNITPLAIVSPKARSGGG
jgi:hypothetical protein